MKAKKIILTLLIIFLISVVAFLSLVVLSTVSTPQADQLYINLSRPLGDKQLRRADELIPGYEYGVVILGEDGLTITHIIKLEK